MTTPVPRRTALRSAAAALVVAGAAASCSGLGGDGADGDAERGDDGGSGRHGVTPRAAGASGVAGSVDPATTPLDELTATASRALLDAASAVVVSSGDDGDVRAGVAAARHLGIPLLVAGPALAAELDRLGARTVLRYAAGTSGTPPPSQVPTELGDREVVEGTSVEDLPDLPGLPVRPPAGAATALVLDGVDLPTVLEPVLLSVGAERLPVAVPDPRASEHARAGLAARPDAPVLAVGRGFGADDVLAQRVRTAARAPELPGGGLLPFPGRMMVALYGHPETSALGMLGEQSASEAVQRVTELAEEYAALTDTTVVPAFELIATVASVSKQDDASYSRRTDVDILMPWVEAAEDAGVYVVLDLQPGRTDFLTQARAYEELLRRPWVGLALDPEWRLRRDQVHLKQIGSVGIEEVNEVGAWLAGLVREHDLPPKVLTLHQFNLKMIRDRERLDTSIDEIQWLLHADGQGPQGAKQETWAALRRDLPRGVWLGWKNFEDEDSPMLTVEQTMARVEPTPSFVSYQ